MKIEDCRAEISEQSSFPLSEMTVSVRCFCEFIRTEKFYAKSLAKWAELYYNITVLFFGIGTNEDAAYGENGETEFGYHDTENRV